VSGYSAQHREDQLKPSIGPDAWQQAEHLRASQQADGDSDDLFLAHELRGDKAV
jgi:hypothetical protein